METEASTPRDRRNRRQDAENYVHAVLFQIELLDALPLDNVVKREVRGPFNHSRTHEVSDPGDIFPEFGFANPREPHPDFSFIERQHAPAPSQQSATAVDLLQVDNLVHLQGARVGNHDSSIDSREVDSVTANQPVMRRLHCDINSLGAVVEADGVALLESRDPGFAIELEHKIWMRPVWLGAIDLPIIDIAGKARPWNLVQGSPLRQHLAVRGELMTLSSPVLATRRLPSEVAVT